MNKKIIVTFIIAILIIIVGIIAYIVLQNDRTENNEQLNKESSTNEQNSMEEQKNNQINESDNNNSKIAVIYFSATGTTEKIAKYISEEINADLVKIEPKEPYTSADLNYSSDCRANKEQSDENSRPEIKNKIDAQDYDVIYLGYPIWWGTVPRIILTFLDSYNLDGKTVIPFCTSGGSGISKSQTDLKSYKTNVIWKNGKGFNSSSNQSSITSWINEVND